MEILLFDNSNIDTTQYEQLTLNVIRQKSNCNSITNITIDDTKKLILVSLLKISERYAINYDIAPYEISMSDMVTNLVYSTKIEYNTEIIELSASNYVEYYEKILDIFDGYFLLKLADKTKSLNTIDKRFYYFILACLKTIAKKLIRRDLDEEWYNTSSMTTDIISAVNRRLAYAFKLSYEDILCLIESIIYATSIRTILSCNMEISDISGIYTQRINENNVITVTIMKGNYASINYAYLMEAISLLNAHAIREHKPAYIFKFPESLDRDSDYSRYEPSVIQYISRSEISGYVCYNTNNLLRLTDEEYVKLQDILMKTFYYTEHHSLDTSTLVNMLFIACDIFKVSNKKLIIECMLNYSDKSQTIRDQYQYTYNKLVLRLWHPLQLTTYRNKIFEFIDFESLSYSEFNEVILVVCTDCANAISTLNLYNILLQHKESILKIVKTDESIFAKTKMSDDLILLCFALEMCRSYPNWVTKDHRYLIDFLNPTMLRSYKSFCSDNSGLSIFQTLNYFKSDNLRELLLYVLLLASMKTYLCNLRECFKNNSRPNDKTIFSDISEIYYTNFLNCVKEVIGFISQSCFKSTTWFQNRIAGVLMTFMETTFYNSYDDSDDHTYRNEFFKTVYQTLCDSYLSDELLQTICNLSGNNHPFGVDVADALPIISNLSNVRQFMLNEYTGKALRGIE